MNDARNLLEAVAEFLTDCQDPVPDAKQVTRLQNEAFELVDKLAAEARQRAAAGGNGRVTAGS